MDKLLEELGWYRVDARGNRPGIETRFAPPQEWLAFQPRLVGEATFTEIWPAPLPVVVAALQRWPSYEDLLENLPDIA